MHQIISDAARIREMDTVELVEWYHIYKFRKENSWDTKSRKHLSELLCLINSQYLQLTNKKLF